MKPIYITPLPQGWIEVELRQAVILKRGYSWSKDQEVSRPEPGTTPVIRIPNIQARLDLTDLLHLRGLTETDLARSAVTKGWILFVGSNGNENRIGDSVLVDCDMQMVFASFLMGMTPKNPGELLPEFLALWMKIHNVHEAFSKTSQKTSGLGNFSWSAVKRLPVRYPTSLNEQRSIVRMIRLVDDYIALTSAKGKFLRDISVFDAKGQDKVNGESDSDESEPDLNSTGSVNHDDSELEAAMRLKYALLQEVVTGAKPLQEAQA